MYMQENPSVSEASCPLAETLKNFLDDKANPINNDIILEVDDTFRKSLIANCNEWTKEKMDIYLQIKSYFSSYINRMIMQKEMMLFQDFYEKKLQPLLKVNFEQSIVLAQSKFSDKVVFLSELEKFVYMSFTSFTADAVYTQLAAQNNFIKTSKEKMDDLDNKHDEVIKSIENQSQKVSETSMTILGIFVGVVMVFFGGFTILENSISGMAKSTPYRLAFTMLLFGLILLNVVVMLFYLIGKLTKKTITCECYKYVPIDASKSPESKNSVTYRSACMNCASRKHLIGICRFRHIVPYIYWGNVVILTLMVFVFFMYALQTFEWNEDTGLGFTRRFGRSGVTWPQMALSGILASAFFVVCFLLGRTRNIEKRKNKEKKKLEKQSMKDKKKQDIAKAKEIKRQTQVEKDMESLQNEKKNVTQVSFDSASNDETSDSLVADELKNEQPQVSIELVDPAGSTVPPPC